MSARKDKTVLLVLLRKLCCFVTKRVLFVKESDYSRQNQSFMFGNSAKSISISIDCARVKICMALQKEKEFQFIARVKIMFDFIKRRFLLEF